MPHWLTLGMLVALVVITLLECIQVLDHHNLFRHFERMNNENRLHPDGTPRSRGESLDAWRNAERAEWHRGRRDVHATKLLFVLFVVTWVALG